MANYWRLCGAPETAPNKPHSIVKVKKMILCAGVAALLAACDAKVNVPPSENTTVVTPGEKKETTIVNPAPKSDSSTSTTTTNTPAGSSTTTTETKQ